MPLLSHRFNKAIPIFVLFQLLFATIFGSPLSTITPSLKEQMDNTLKDEKIRINIVLTDQFDT